MIIIWPNAIFALVVILIYSWYFPIKSWKRAWIPLVVGYCLGTVTQYFGYPSIIFGQNM